MLETRRCLLPARPTHGPTLLGILTATLTLLLIHSHPLSAQLSQYPGQESYAIYPGWTGPEMEEGLLQLTFRTSVSQGLLLYAEGTVASMWTEALAVILEEGRISVKIQRQQVRIFGNGMAFPLEDTESEQISVSENLNDNMPHTLSLQQTADKFTVSVLDRSASESSRLLARSSNIGSMRIYIGGLPSDTTPLFAISGHFRGCLGDIQYANNSANASSLVPVSPLTMQNIAEGCSDPCAGVLCGGGAGRCVPLLPDRYFCDCSSTQFGGANCSEDLSMHRLNLTLDSHLCYALDSFPFTNSAGSVRLLAPLPQTGTIMTGVSSSGNQFNLYLDESILNFELISANISVKLSTNQALDGSTNYQINFEIRNDRVDLVLETLSESGSVVIETLNSTLTFPVATFFTTVCVGGTMLEIPYYVGLLERVIYIVAPLSDQQFVQQYATVETPVNLISISEVSDTPLTFQRFTFADNYQRITFELRLDEDPSNGLTGTPLSTRGDTLQAIVTNGDFSIVSLNGPSGPFFVDCSGTPKVNNEWHIIDIILSRSDNGAADLSASVDNVSCSPLTEDQRIQFGEIFDLLINSSAPLEFGVTQRSMFMDGRFVGCLQNIEFRETADSDPVCPDLASAIRSQERFSRGEEQCYSCMDKTPSMPCPSGEMCADCGYLHPAQCLDSLNNCPAQLVIPSPTNPTTTSATIPTTLTPSTPTTLTPSTPMTSGTTVNFTSPVNQPQLGLYIGVAIGAAVVIIIIVTIAILLLCLCVRVKAGGQGFYKTEESNGKAVTMLHYSASLRQIASEQVTMAETNGVSPMHADGLRAKEFYM